MYIEIYRYNGNSKYSYINIYFFIVKVFICMYNSVLVDEDIFEGLTLR